MTATLEVVLVVSAAASATGRLLTRWISEHSRTTRQREALDALERLAISHPTSAPLVADVLRAGDHGLLSSVAVAEVAPGERDRLRANTGRRRRRGQVQETF